MRIQTKILTLAFLVRIVVFIAAAKGMFLIGEGRVEADLACNLLEGRGFMLSGEMLNPPEEAHGDDLFRETMSFYRSVDGYYGVLRPDQPTLFLVPGYAVFMAGIFAVFGMKNYLAVRGIQLLLGLITVLICFRIAGKFLKGRYLTLAGIFMAIDPFELYYEAIPATQALFSLVFLCGILISLKLIDTRGGFKKVVTVTISAGVVWGVAFFVRPAALPIIVWLALLLPFIPLVRQFTRGGVAFSGGKRLFSGKRLIASVILLAAFLLVLLPWGLRNDKVCGEFRIMPTQGGVNIWEYNGRIFSSRFGSEMQGAMLLYGGLREEYSGKLNSPELAEFPTFTDESEWERDEILFERNLSFMMQNPVLSLRLISLRFAEFFKPFPLNSFSLIYVLIGLISFFWVLIFFGSGIIRVLFNNGPQGFFFGTAVLGYILMHLLTASGTPHRTAIDFPMAIAALVGIEYVVRRFNCRKKCSDEA